MEEEKVTGQENNDEQPAVEEKAAEAEMEAGSQEKEEQKEEVKEPEKTAGKSEKTGKEKKETSKGAKTMTKDELIDVLKSMTVLELSELVKALEEEFGVTAAPVAVAGVAPAGGAAQKTKCGRWRG